MTAPLSGHSDPLPLDSPERRRLPPLLRRAWYGLNQAFRRRIAHTGVTPDQFTVMRILLETESGALNQRELAAIMSSDPNTVAALLERMEAAGWIARRPSATDKRAHRLQLQPLGREKYVEVREIAVALQRELLSVLPENQRENFLKNLAALAEACQKSAENELDRPAASR